MSMRHELVSDLHKLLFCIPLDSAKDNWDLNAKLGRELLNHHSVCFKDKEDIEGSQYWITDDVEAHFYDVLCPGGFVSVTELENICEQYLELDLWDGNRQLNDICHGLMKSINKITETFAAFEIPAPVQSSHKDQYNALQSIEPLQKAS